MSPRVVAFGTAAALMSACALVTDLRTSGYTPSDAGSCTAGSDGGCSAASGGLCQSANDCLPGQVCCLSVSESPSPSFSIGCQFGASCAGSMAQLCGDAAECGGASCVACSFAGGTTMLQICGQEAGVALCSGAAP